MLDDQLVQSFMTNFFGYGSLEASYWFIGMEEAGGATEEEIQNRMDRWKHIGSGKTVDNFEFHNGVKDGDGKSLGYLFEPNASIQPTWRGLIRIYLTAIGMTAMQLEDVRLAQINNWGRMSSNNCLLEILPLPSPGTDHWNYKDWSNLDFLKDRDSYTNSVSQYRAAELRKMVWEHQPSVVVFYSTNQNYLQYWSYISGVTFTDDHSVLLDVNKSGMRLTAKIHKMGGIVFVNCLHSTSRGVTNKYFDRLGLEIRKRIY